MIAIEMRFLTGKYHATPWGRQVNEGAVEWPPSPWRVLRTLIAAWHNKFPDIPEAEMRALIGQLSSAPLFRLPPSHEGHTRHYMPVASDTKTKIFDTFITLNPQDPLVICWRDAELSDSQQSLLKRLTQSLNYFGRAESWVEADTTDEVDGAFDAVLLSDIGVGENEELVRILGPSDDSAYRQWKEETFNTMVGQKLAEERAKATAKGKQTDKVKLSQKVLDSIEASLPKDLFESLQCDTGELRKGGWNRPPASQWLAYVRTNRSPDLSNRHCVSSIKLPTVARYAVAGAVRPQLTDAVIIGDRMRRYLMGICGKRNGGICSAVFSGKTEDGKPLSAGTAQHSHAHYMAESCGLNNRGRITHLSVFAPSGFCDADQSVLSSLTEMYGSGGHDLQLVLLGIGSQADFGGTDQRKGRSPAMATSSVWVSRTPLVLTDHLRIRRSERRNPDTSSEAVKRELERLVRRELARRPWLAEYACDVSIQPWPHTMLGGTKTSWLKFRRQRIRGGGNCSSSNGYGFRLTFGTPVTGPIALGYGSHFGLGLFEAAD